MKILKNKDIVSVTAGDLKPGMILPDGIVKEVDATLRGTVYITFFGGHVNYAPSIYTSVNVIGKVDDVLLVNMMGA